MEALRHATTAAASPVDPDRFADWIRPHLPAAVMGCADGTVKSTLAEARNRLRTPLEVPE